MKLSRIFLVQILFSLLLLLGIVSAHPHKIGIINHGPSLEDYQIKIDYTNGKVKIPNGKSIKITDKNSIKDINKKNVPLKTNKANKVKPKTNNKDLTLKVKLN